MDFDKYTERARGFIQSSQGLAVRSNHLRVTPQHLFKVLLDDDEGLCANLIRSAGGDPAIAHEREWLTELPAPPSASDQR